MTDPRLSDGRRPSGKIPAITDAVLIAMLAVGPLTRAGLLKGNPALWVFLVFGIIYSFHVASDIRRGRTATERSSVDPLDDAVRFAPHPSLFWFVIALKGAVAALAIGVALAGFLGLWT